MNTQKTLYERDFYAWVNHQALLLKQKKFGEVDFVNVIEELETLGRSEKKELGNRMSVLIMHLLKWKYQSEMNGASWGKTIREQRRQIMRNLKDSPSLKSLLRDTEWLNDVWEDATYEASEETSLDYEVFPSSPIWSIDEILDKDFYPEPEQATDEA